MNAAGQKFRRVVNIGSKAWSIEHGYLEFGELTMISGSILSRLLAICGPILTNGLLVISPPADASRIIRDTTATTFAGAHQGKFLRISGDERLKKGFNQVGFLLFSAIFKRKMQKLPLFSCIFTQK